MSANITERPSYSNCNEISPQCPVEATLYGDYFNLGACVFFTVAYSIAFIAQVYLGWRSKAWSFVSYLAVGTIFELSGYAARIALSSNPWIYGAFVIQLLFLILAPTLVAAAISVTFKHLVLHYGPEWSVLRPRLYPWVFVGTDFISIVIQAVGAAVAAFATSGAEENQSLSDVSSALLVTGVVFQVANMVICGGLMLIYVWRYRKGHSRRTGPGNEGNSGFRVIPPGTKSDRPDEEKKLKIFIISITIAYIAIVIRCIYRVPEMAEGWGSDLMQDEITFLVLDGAMILVAVLLLTIFHPAVYFPSLGKKNDKVLERRTGSNDYEMQ
ncbi:uncharacterized protein CTRU02_201277 [Colletotrichum truncatum]|uniref:Uncharacterized protein n=1 Tax=Colletotrichum truncatum TaxID=5467 RepID=A0ACC3ZGY5_COLTU|nr:uncharacterized protein CTRU02_08067 [Colletotrichum truncatum]KAF6790547.1 hypothetical protein CTRU02_08067 [Colletotrichum truncatum]